MLLPFPHLCQIQFLCQFLLLLISSCASSFQTSLNRFAHAMTEMMKYFGVSLIALLLSFLYDLSMSD